jgi:ABC-type transporter Mla MlaB component
MLRMTAAAEGDRQVVHLAGRISVGDVLQLEALSPRACCGLCLDLSQVLSADDAGVATLRSLRRQGVVLRAPTPYLRLLLDPELLDSEDSP